jgi:hypothetical protein
LMHLVLMRGSERLACLSYCSTFFRSFFVPKSNFAFVVMM